MNTALKLPMIGNNTKKDMNEVKNKKCKFLFTDEAWEIGGSNLCPACRKSPIQLLFDSSISKGLTIGECMLCKQLVAYRKNIHARKRTKNSGSSFNLGSKKLEVLNFFKMIETCECIKNNVDRNEMKNKIKNRNDSNQNQQLKFDW